MNKQYVLDADLLINASRNYYAFDIAPAFWSQLVAKGRGRAIFVDKVCSEICKAGDQLSEWFQANAAAFAVKSSEDAEVTAAYSRIITAVEGNTTYFASAKAAFANSAESWLCAHALAYGYTVVTQEAFEPKSRHEVTVPNVCREFDLEYLDLFQLIRVLGIRFEA